MTRSATINPDEHYARCYVLFGAASHVHTTSERIDRELLAALMHAVQVISAFMHSPKQELRMQVQFAVSKFDAQFAGLDDSLSLRGRMTSVLLVTASGSNCVYTPTPALNRLPHRRE